MFSRAWLKVFHKGRHGNSAPWGPHLHRGDPDVSSWPRLCTSLRPRFPKVNSDPQVPGRGLRVTSRGQLFYGVVS